MAAPVKASLLMSAVVVAVSALPPLSKSLALTPLWPVIRKGSEVTALPVPTFLLSKTPAVGLISDRLLPLCKARPLTLAALKPATSVPL